MSRLVRSLPILLLVTLLAACAGGPNKKSAGEVIDDTVIATRVKSALIGDDRVKARHIEVEVYKGTVQLSGFAETEEQIVAAEEIAADVPGVVDVKIRIDLRGG
ncbi:MAG: BON domain-containing protein [Pseudomonadota bacterium]